MAEKQIREFLKDREVFSEDFHLETSQAEPFVFEWHRHSRPGPSFYGSEHTSYITNGVAKEVMTDQRYDYPCFDDADYKVSITGWTWILRFHSSQYATDNQEYTDLTLTIWDEASTKGIVSIINEVLAFGLQDATPSNTNDITSLVQEFLAKRKTFADLRKAVS